MKPEQRHTANTLIKSKYQIQIQKMFSITFCVSILFKCKFLFEIVRAVRNLWLSQLTDVNEQLINRKPYTCPLKA